MGFTLGREEADEVAVTFASLILHDDKAPITAENISKILEAANVQVEPFWPKIFADLLEGKDVGEILLSSGGGGGGGAAAAGAEAGAGGAAEEAPKEEEPESESDSDDEMEEFSLFD